MAGGLFGLGRRRTAVVGALAGLIVLVALWLVVRDLGHHSSSHLNATGTSTSSSTSTTLTLETSETTTSTVPEPTTTLVAVTPTTAATASATTSPPAPVVLTAAGALLQPQQQPATQSTAGPNSDCHGLGDPGWTVTECDRFVHGTSPAVALVEKNAPSQGPGSAWRAYVLHFSQGKGTWLRDLAYADDTGSQVAQVSYVEHDLTGDGVPEVVFGFRFQGSGSVLAYDVVDRLFTGVRVGAHRDLSHGQAAVGPSSITEWDAKYLNGAPNCCPSYYQQGSVSWNGTAWVQAAGAHVANAGQGNF